MPYTIISALVAFLVFVLALVTVQGTDVLDVIFDPPTPQWNVERE